MSIKIYEAKISKKIFILPAIFAFLIAINGFGEVYPFVPILILIPSFIKYKYTNLILYEDKIKGEIGFFGKERINAPLDKINDVETDNGIFGGIIGYGNILISTSSTIIDFKGMANCEELNQKILEQIEIYKKEQIKEQARIMAEAMKQASK